MELKPLQVKIIQRLSKTNKSEELRNKLRSWIVTNEVSVTDLLYNIEQKNVIVSSSILNKLGLLYGQGKEGLVENPETAFLFYLTSAKLGNASANGNVAQYYYDGRAIGGQNLELAYQFCLKSLLLGGDKNMLMGEILFESENYVEAIKYLRKILDTNTESKSFEKQRLRSEARELEKSCLFQLLNSTFPEINLGLVGLNSSSYEQNSSFLSSPSTPIAVPASDTPKRPQLALSLLANSLSKNLQIYTDISTSGATDGTVNNSKYNNNVSTPYNRTASPSNMRLSSTKNVNSNNGNHSTPTNGQPLLLTPTSTKHKTAQNNSNVKSGVFVFVNHKTNDTSNNSNNNSNITPRGSNTPRNSSNNNFNNNNNNYNSFFNSNNTNDNNNNTINNNNDNNNSSTMMRLASPMRHNLNTTVDASVFVKKLLTHECPGWFYVTDNLDGFDQNSCMELTAKAKILELECVAIKSAYESAEAHIELARKNNFSKEIIKILVSTKVSEFEEVYRKLEQNKVTLLEAWNKYIDTDEHTLRRQINMENLFFSPAHTANYHTYNLAKHLLARRVYDGTVDVRSSYGVSDAYGSSDMYGVSTYLSNGNENNGAEPIYLSKFSAQNRDNSGNNSTVPNAKVLITAERALLETAIVAYGRGNNSSGGVVQKTGWTAYSSEANSTTNGASTVKTPKTPTNISYNGITNGTADMINSNSKSVTHNISYNHTNVQNNNTNNNSSINNSGKPSTPISPTRAVFNVTHVNRPLSPTRIQQQNSVTTTPTNKNNRSDVSFSTNNNSSSTTTELINRQPNDVDLATNANNTSNNANNNSNTTNTNIENDERSFITTEYTHPETVVLGETILKYKHNTTTVLAMNNNSINSNSDNNNSELPLDFIILNEPALENSSTVLAFIYKLLNIPLYFYTLNSKNSAQLSADREQYVLLESHLATLIHAFVSKGQLITLQSLSTLNEDICESDVHTLNKVIYTVFVKHIVKYVVSGGQNRNNNKGNSNNNNINSNNNRINSQNASPMRINSSINNNNINSNSNTNSLTNNSTQRVGANVITTTITTNANVSDTQLPLATAVSRALSLIKLGVLTFHELFNSESEYSVLCGFGYSGVIDSNSSVAGTQQQLTLREKIINVNHLYNKAIMENSNADQYRDIVQFWKHHGNSGLMIPTYKALHEELATTYGSGVNDTVSFLEPLYVMADFQDFELENLLKKIEI